MNAYLFDLPGVTSQQYDQMCRALNHGQPLRELADWPVPGIIAHLAGPTPAGWRQVDVWESEEALGRFRQHLLPLFEQAGLPVVAPQVFPVHNIVTR